jgi:lysozyme family protein
MFSDFLPILKRSEGGYSNLLNDKGGETYAGITRKNFPTWAGWVIIDAAKPKQNQIIVNPKLDTLIADFYKKNFWDVLQCDKLSKYVGMNLCDFAINSGVNTAAKSFQNVINSLLPTGATTLVTDGKIGALTIAAATKLNQQKLNDALLDYRKKFYENIVNSNPTQRQFLRGWINRLTDFTFIEEIKKKVNVNYVLIGGAILALLLVLKYKK